MRSLLFFVFLRNATLAKFLMGRKLFFKEKSNLISQERKIVESSNLVKLVFRSVNFFLKKIEQKIFRLECPFKTDHLLFIFTNATNNFAFVRSAPVSPEHSNPISPVSAIQGVISSSQEDHSSLVAETDGKVQFVHFTTRYDNKDNQVKTLNLVSRCWGDLLKRIG